MSNSANIIMMFQQQHRLLDSDMLRLLTTYVDRQQPDEAIFDFLHESIATKLSGDTEVQPLACDEGS